MVTIDLSRKRVLFLSPTEGLSPILQAQGIPHMRELTKRFGIQFLLFTVERRDWTNEDKDRVSAIEDQLKRWGIEWRFIHNSSIPFLPNSAADLACALLPVLRLLHVDQILA